MNLAESHLLRRLDEGVDHNQPKTVETQYGDIVVDRAKTGIFFAAFTYEGAPKFYSHVASVAFINLVDKFREDRENNDLSHWKMPNFSEQIAESTVPGVVSLLQATQAYQTIG